MLNHHLVFQYSYQPTKRLFSKRIIKQYLERFVEDNPDFGKMTTNSRFRRSISTRNTAVSDDNPFYFPQLTYPISSNLLDTDLEDGENVYDILEQITTNERIRSRRRFRVRPQQPPPPPPQPQNTNEDQDEPSDIEETVLDNVEIENDTEDQVEEQVDEDTEVNEDEDEEEDEDQGEDEDNEQIDSFSSGPNDLQIIGTGISSLDISSNSVYVDNSTNTITSRYVSRSHPSRGARIEYTTHTVTRYPGTSSTLSRSTYANSTSTLPPSLTTPTPPGLTNTYRAIDNIISNIYNPPLSASTTSNYFPNNYNSTQITSNDTTSNSNINIYETHNSPFDASMDIEDDSEIDTPTSTTSNTDPFAQSHPEGFNGSYE